MCRLRQRCDPRCFAICTLALLSCRADGDASHGDPVHDGGTPDSAVRDASEAELCSEAPTGSDGGGSTEVGSGTNCTGDPQTLVDVVQEIVACAPNADREAPVIAVDATHIYFMLQWVVAEARNISSRGYLMRVPRDGGAAERIASLPHGSIRTAQAMALTSTRVIFIQAPNDSTGNSTIASVPLEGGDVTVLAKASGIATVVVVDSDSAYFGDSEGVKKVPVTGGELRPLVAGVAPLTLVAVGGNLYYASADGVYSVSTGGGEPTTIDSSGGGRSLISCGSGVCWLGGAALMGTLVQRLPTSRPTILTSGLRQAHDVVFDGEAYFVTGGFGGALFRVPAEGGTAALVYTEPLLTHVAIQGECLYLSSGATISSVSLTAARTRVVE